jgi:hypothetical protein
MKNRFNFASMARDGSPRAKNPDLTILSKNLNGKSGEKKIEKSSENPLTNLG